MQAWSTVLTGWLPTQAGRCMGRGILNQWNASKWFACTQVLWEFLQPIAFKILAHFGYGLIYYKCRWKVCVALFAARFSSSSHHVGDCEFLPLLWVYPQRNSLCYTPLRATMELYGMPTEWHPCSLSPWHCWALPRPSQPPPTPCSWTIHLAQLYNCLIYTTDADDE